MLTVSSIIDIDILYTQMSCKKFVFNNGYNFICRYFDNFLEGYFLLYRNKILPYQVLLLLLLLLLLL